MQNIFKQDLMLQIMNQKEPHLEEKIIIKCINKISIRWYNETKNI